MVGNINNFSKYSPFSSDLKVLYEIKTNFSNKEKVRFSNYFLLLSWAISTILISSHRNITTLRSCQTWRSFLCFQRMYSEGSKSSGEKIEKEKKRLSNVGISLLTADCTGCQVGDRDKTSSKRYYIQNA